MNVSNGSRVLLAARKVCSCESAMAGYSWNWCLGDSFGSLAADLGRACFQAVDLRWGPVLLCSTEFILIGHFCFVLIGCVTQSGGSTVDVGSFTASSIARLAKFGRTHRI